MNRLCVDCILTRSHNTQTILTIIGIHALRYICTYLFPALKLTVSQSYHDLAVRLEPIILELEKEKNDLLIIAHESVLRVLYAYLMACDAMSIPGLKFPRNEIVEVRCKTACGLVLEY